MSTTTMLEGSFDVVSPRGSCPCGAIVPVDAVVHPATRR
jgi:hypothetical protein